MISNFMIMLPVILWGGAAVFTALLIREILNDDEE